MPKTQYFKFMLQYLPSNLCNYSILSKKNPVKHRFFQIKKKDINRTRNNKIKVINFKICQWKNISEFPMASISLKAKVIFSRISPPVNRKVFWFFPLLFDFFVRFHHHCWQCLDSSEVIKSNEKYKKTIYFTRVWNTIKKIKQLNDHKNYIILK